MAATALSALSRAGGGAVLQRASNVSASCRLVQPTGRSGAESAVLAAFALAEFRKTESCNQATPLLSVQEAIFALIDAAAREVDERVSMRPDGHLPITADVLCTAQSRPVNAAGTRRGISVDPQVKCSVMNKAANEVCTAAAMARHYQELCPQNRRVVDVHPKQFVRVARGKPSFFSMPCGVTTRR